MNELWSKFNQYQRSEQVAILVMVGAVLVFLLWVAVISPLEKKRNQLITANHAAIATLGKVKTMVATIHQQGAGQQSGSGENINSLVDSSIRSAGLMMNSFQPGANGEVRVRLDNANYAALMQWLYDMEYTHGVTIKDVSIASTNDTGVVNANIRLQKH